MKNNSIKAVCLILITVLLMTSLTACIRLGSFSQPSVERRTGGDSRESKESGKSKESKTSTESDTGTDTGKTSANPQKVRFVNYDNGLFRAKIPEGWEVRVLETSDYIHYTFQIYDPKNPKLCVYFNMKTEGYMSSEEEYNWYTSIYPDTIFTGIPWLDPATTEYFFSVFNQAMDVNNTENFTFPTLSDLKMIESFGTDQMGAETIRAKAVSADGTNVEGIFYCSIMPFNMYYVTFYNVYSTMFVTAPEGELGNWIEVLSKTLGSIEFTDKFTSELNKELAAQGEAAREIDQICSDMTEIINRAWEERTRDW